MIKDYSESQWTVKLNGAPGSSHLTVDSWTVLACEGFRYSVYYPSALSKRLPDSVLISRMQVVTPTCYGLDSVGRTFSIPPGSCSVLAKWSCTNYCYGSVLFRIETVVFEDCFSRGVTEKGWMGHVSHLYYNKHICIPYCKEEIVLCMLLIA